MTRTGTSVYPSTLDSFDRIGTTNFQDELGYSIVNVENEAMDAIEKIESVIGTTAGTSVLVDIKLLTKIITFERDNTGTTTPEDVAYTGVGFKPTSLHALSVWDPSDYYSDGFSDSSGSSIAIYVAAVGGFKAIDGALIIFSDSTANFQQAAVKSYNDDGFTLTWTKTGAPSGTTQCKVICYR